MKEAVSSIYSPIEKLETVGPKRAAELNKVGVFQICDLFYYLPRRYLDRSYIGKIASLKNGQETTIIARVVNSEMRRGRRNRFHLYVTDGTSYLTCVWFSKLSYWLRTFKTGEWLALSGKVTRFEGLQMVHPEFDRLGENAEGELVNTGKIIPLYPSTEALTKSGFDSRGFRRLIVKLIHNYKDKIEETIPATIVARRQLMPLADALDKIHFPDNWDILYQARERLKFDELFFMELIIALRKKHIHTDSGGIRFSKVGGRVKTLVDNLPFELTGAQKRVIREIYTDMKSSRPMNRLLQGDVGSGKTMVALIAMLIAVENGYQAAMMAPTEILAEQHFYSVSKALQPIGANTVLLIGAQNKATREKTLEAIATRQADIIIGTHALIQENVEFNNLGLVIIDEQHRFGVIQRARLREKGLKPDVLVMTATPIPRTLSLTVYGDLDVSILDEMPHGRKPVLTKWRTSKQRSKVYHFLRDQIAAGKQAFIVFPLVEETEKSDLKAATDSYEKMRTSFFRDYSLGLIHGRMKSEEKEAAMAAFKSGQIQILVSTTVIEVGVDVPNATIIIIEHAERFGLTQLHQLRGRVGRGSEQSFCILIAYGELSEEARKRLDTMAATNDGFKLAEIDLELRGPGDFFGTRQHGLPDLRIANIVADIKLLRIARKEAFELVAKDPQLIADGVVGTRHHFIKNYRDKYDLAWVA